MNQNQLPQGETSKLWNRNYIMVLILSVFNSSASQMIDPLISGYAISLGAEMTLAATISGLMSIVALFFRPISGLVNDRYNRKKVIICTSLVTAACMYLYSLVDSKEMLITVRTIHGIVFSFSGVAMMAFNTSFMPRDRLAEGMGWMALGSIISNSLGPSLGMWLVDNVGYWACFVTAAGICLVTTAIIFLIPYQHPVRVGEAKKLDFSNLFSLRLLPYALLTALFSWGNGLVKAFLKLMANERGLANVALFFTAYSIFMVVCRPIVGRIQDKKGIKVVLYPSFAIAAVGMLFLGHANAGANIVVMGISMNWMIVVAAILKAIGQGAGSPSIQAHCLKIMGRDKAGLVSSTYYIGGDIGNAISPTIGALIYKRFGYNFMFSTYAVALLVFGWGLFAVKYRYDQKKYGDC